MLLSNVKGNMPPSSDLLQGTLDLLILKTLALESMHGWGISQRIQQISESVLQVNQGSLYPALHRLEKRGEIRRVIRGIYDYPRFSKLLDQNLSPDIDQVARALARKFRWRIQPTGATALNFLGLSTQVPARAVYLSDGPDRVYQIANTALAFEHTALKESGIELKESGLIVQALKSLGQERITPEIISKIRAWLPESLRAKVHADTKTATGWVYSAIQQITQEAVHG